MLFVKTCTYIHHHTKHVLYIMEARIVCRYRLLKCVILLMYILGIYAFKAVSHFVLKRLSIRKII